MPTPRKNDDDASPLVIEPGADDAQPDLGDLESLEGAEYADVTWYVYRLDGERTSPATGGAYEIKLTGALDLDQLRERIGGGRFRLFGKRRDNQPPIRRVVVIAGPAHVAAPAGPVPASPTAPASEIAQLVGVFRDELAQLRREMRESTARDPAQLDLVIKVLEMSRQFQPQPAPAAAVDSVVNALQKGLELGQSISGGGGETAAIIRELAPVLPMLFARAAPAAAPGRALPAPGRAGAPAPALAPVPPAAGALVERQGLQLAELIARAIELGREPVELADSLDTLLTDDELAHVAQLSPARIIELMGPQRQLYPALRDDARLGEYLTAVLAALNTPDDEGAEPAAG